MNIWLITDTHLGHDKMIPFCGRPADHSERILKNLKNSIKENDLLIHLGDVCIGKDEYWHQQLIIALPICKRWLLTGNHDSKSNSWYLNHGWDFVAETLKDTYFGKRVLLSHYPQKYDGNYDINIHGHFHNNAHRKEEPELIAIQNDKQKLLAIENTNLSPVTLENFIR